MQSSMTAQLVSYAMLMANWRRRPSDEPVHHSDRSSQCSSDQFQQLVAQRGVLCSMSRSGNCEDNAAMQSFFSTLKAGRTGKKVCGCRWTMRLPTPTRGRTWNRRSTSFDQPRARSLRTR